MSMIFQGTVKSGGVFDVNCKDGSKKTLVSFTAVDEIGNVFACQMWPDDPQQADLARVIEQARRQPIQFEVAGYTVRLRKMKDGTQQAQGNFVVSRVSIPSLGLQAK
jgi:hypothetical protein